MDATVRKMLRCPIDLAALRDDADALACVACGRRYPLIDGIPDLVASDTEDDVSTPNQR